MGQLILILLGDNPNIHCRGTKLCIEIWNEYFEIIVGKGFFYLAGLDEEWGKDKCYGR